MSFFVVTIYLKKCFNNAIIGMYYNSNKPKKKIQRDNTLA